MRELVPNDRGFKFQSDEFNGKNRRCAADGSQEPNVDPYNFIRCKDQDINQKFCSPTPFASFSDAEDKNAMSRVWMGVHWRFDATDGEALGEQIGTLVLKTVMQPE